MPRDSKSYLHHTPHVLYPEQWVNSGIRQVHCNNLPARIHDVIVSLSSVSESTLKHISR